MTPLKLPQPCPICQSSVYLTSVNCWETDKITSAILGVDYECETEPDIDSDDWESWFHWHYRMPYVDWLPWEINMLEWLNKNYRYDGEQLTGREAKGDEDD